MHIYTHITTNPNQDIDEDIADLEEVSSDTATTGPAAATPATGRATPTTTPTISAVTPATQEITVATPAYAPATIAATQEKMGSTAATDQPAETAAAGVTDFAVTKMELPEGVGAAIAGVAAGVAATKTESVPDIAALTVTPVADSPVADAGGGGGGKLAEILAKKKAARAAAAQ